MIAIFHYWLIFECLQCHGADCNILRNSKDCDIQRLLSRMCLWGDMIFFHGIKPILSLLILFLNIEIYFFSLSTDDILQMSAVALPWRLSLLWFADKEACKLHCVVVVPVVVIGIVILESITFVIFYCILLIAFTSHLSVFQLFLLIMLFF